MAKRAEYTLWTFGATRDGIELTIYVMFPDHWLHMGASSSTAARMTRGGALLVAPGILLTFSLLSLPLCAPLCVSASCSGLDILPRTAHSLSFHIRNLNRGQGHSPVQTEKVGQQPDSFP